MRYFPHSVMHTLMYIVFFPRFAQLVFVWAKLTLCARTLDNLWNILSIPNSRVNLRVSNRLRLNSGWSGSSGCNGVLQITLGVSPQNDALLLNLPWSRPDLALTKQQLENGEQTQTKSNRFEEFPTIYGT